MKKKISASPGKLLPSNLYAKVGAYIPFVCADAIVKTKSGILLGLRNNNPDKGHYSIIGGRVFIGETLEDGMQRIVKEETGLDVSVKRLVAVFQTSWPDGSKRDGDIWSRKQTMNTNFIVEVTGGKLRKDSQHSKFIYVKSKASVSGLKLPHVREAARLGLLPRVDKVYRGEFIYGKEYRKWAMWEIDSAPPGKKNWKVETS